MTEKERQRQAFKDYLKANPDDDATRLVFADWLEDHDEPEAADAQRRWKASYAWMAEFSERIGPRIATWVRADGGGEWEGEYSYTPFTVDDLVQGGRDYLAGGDFLIQYGSQSAQDILPDHLDDFWAHWQVLACEAVPEGKKDSFIGCSC